MTRRNLILKFVQRIPEDASDVLRMNLFAEAYGVFIEDLNRGVVNAKAWDEVVKRGRALFCTGKYPACA